MTTGKNEFSLVVRASAGKSRPVQLLHCLRWACATWDYQGRSYSGTKLRIGEKGKKSASAKKKKKLASKASREVVWGAFPIPRLSLGSLRLPILFLFDPVFCLFPGAWSQPRQIYSVSAVVYPCLVVEGYSRRCHNDQIMKELKCCEQVLLPLLWRNF